MNLSNKKSYQDLLESKSSLKKIFFYRICGTGMGAAACLLKEKGYDVEGGDNVFAPPMSTYLKSTGIPCHKLSDANDDFLKSFDLIVVGNVVPKNSEDARRIESLGVSFCSFPSALGGLVLDGLNVVGVAGTHGKTTTTYFLTQVFENLGLRPGYFVGGVMNNRPSAYLGDGSYFFIESDEYDSGYFEKISKFRSLSINHLILTSLEFDHADIFTSIEDIKDEFRALLSSLEGIIIYSEDFPEIVNLKKEILEKESEEKTGSKWISYGEKSKDGVKIKKMGPCGSEFTMCFDGIEGLIKTNIIGIHNILNLCAVAQFAFSQGYSYEEIAKAMENLHMVKRRQEVRGYYRGSVVIDDFAHHPRSVLLTVETIKIMYPDQKLTVVFEPNSATARSNIFQNEFQEALGSADKIILTRPTRHTSAKNADDLDIEKMSEYYNKNGKEGYVVEDLGSLISLLDKSAGENQVLLILSNGTCLGLWESEFVKSLSDS